MTYQPKKNEGPLSVQLVTEMDEVQQACKLIRQLLPELSEYAAKLLVDLCFDLLNSSSLDVLSSSDVSTAKADGLELRVSFKVPRLLELVTAANAAFDCHGSHSVAPILSWYRERIVTASSSD